MKKERLMKIIALILCAAMMMCVLSACQEEVIEPETDEAETEEETNDFTTLYEHIENDTPVMKIGDVEITWGVLYYYFYQEATTLYGNSGEIYDWTAEYQDGMTYLEYCVNEAIYNNLRRIAGVEHFAKEYNVTLTDEQLQAMEDDKAYDLELFGDEVAMLEYLSGAYLTEDTVRYLAEIEYLYGNVMDAMVGTEGEKLTVEEITTMADTAYKMVKVVPFAKSEADAYANAEAALAELKTAADAEAKMDELIDTYCDAELTEQLKNGFVFTRGYFDDAVEEVLRDMEKNQYYDGIVEGEEYYYVVLRTPVDVESYPFYGESGYGETVLRNLYRDDIFEEKFWAWADDTAEVTFYDILTQLDIDAVLGWK